MATLILDQDVEKRVRESRHASGLDRYDEVWEGVYMMAPLANNEHQILAFRLAVICQEATGWDDENQVFAGINLSDRDEGWTENYLVPDVAVFLKGTKAQDRETHWLGGPDFAIEIVSLDDRSRDKLPFYAKVATRELVLLDRYPWSLELFRLKRGKLQSQGKITPDDKQSLASDVLDLTFQMQGGSPRPRIAVVHSPSGKTWKV